MKPRGIASRSSRPGLRSLAAALALAVGLALMAPVAATADPQKREQRVLLSAAQLAEVVSASRGTPLPKRLTKKRLAKRYGLRLPRQIRVAEYKRLQQGRHFRVCLRHRKGGWATWHSRTGTLRSSGRGKACRY